MTRSFYTESDAKFLTGSQNFSTLINADPGAVGLTAAQALAYQAADAEWSAAYHAAVDPIPRTRGKIAAKNEKKAAAKAMAQNYASIIESTPGVTDEQKIDLGLVVRGQRLPVPPPSESPIIEVLSVTQRRVRIRLKGTGPRNGRPTGVSGATVFTHVGAEPPADTGAWQFATNTGRTTLTLNFDSSTAADTVWITAFFFNARKESGPATQPISINLPAAQPVPAGAKLKIAA